MTKWKNFFMATVGLVMMTATVTAEQTDNRQSEINADEIEYDSESGVAKASGNVKAKSQSNKETSELNADNVDYDMNSGVVNAEGNVLLKQGTGRATGARAMYNTKTMEAYLVDNVIVERDDMKITCESLRSDGQGHMQASGNVHATQTVAANEKYPNGDTRTFTGEQIDYYPDEGKHVVIPTGGLITMNDGTFTADYMEGWLDEEHYIGTGNAHATNPPRQMEAGGDKADYFGKEDGKLILTGNAWVIQDNNTVRGNRLTVYMADNKKLTTQPAPTTSTEPAVKSPFEGR